MDGSFNNENDYNYTDASNASGTSNTSGTSDSASGDLKGEWKDVGKGLGATFAGLGKTLVKTAKVGLEKADVAAVGDQIFTDITGSNLCGIRSIFVFPIKPEESLPFRFKRAVEKPLLPDFPDDKTDT